MTHPIQSMMDAMGNVSRRTRSDYHLTLGALIEALEKMPLNNSVVFDQGGSPFEFNSYRGYYADLALDSKSALITVGELLGKAKDALGNTFEGYKGGDFIMGPETPLWSAPWGSTGRAIINFSIDGSIVTLHTKEV